MLIFIGGPFLWIELSSSNATADASTGIEPSSLNATTDAPTDAQITVSITLIIFLKGIS